MYSIDDARRECKEMLADGCGNMEVTIFINDLVRGGDITNDERKTLNREWINGEWWVKA